MGEVYRARDTKLNRDVALKILPELFASDPDRLARFQREAQLLASLNHPHIAQIYGFEGREGRDGQELHAIVLELVEGSTLADRIAQGPVPIDEALAIAAQIASALEAAHDRGVVHRDLKPANIKLTPDGTVKVLDFGLAKMLDDGSASASGPSRGALSMSPTLSVHATYAGVILGTAAYMSPEQARGRPVDKRADVWAFGCVLFEMLAGARPFDGDDVAEMIGAVIHKEPAWDRLQASTPANVRLALQRCLQKDPKQRIRDVGDVQLALSGAFESPAPSASSSAPPSGTVRRRSLVVAGAAIAVAAAATWALVRSSPIRPQPMRFSIVPPPTQAFNVQGFFRNLAISDDGTRIVYVGGDAQLIVRAIDQLDAVPLRGINGAAFPFLSPDGRWVGFFTGAGGELKKVSITGGPAITLCRYQGTPRGASWGRGDTIVFATNEPTTGLLSVPAGGGEPTVITKPDASHGEQDHLFPALLPDDRHVLFTITSSAGIDAAQIAVLDLRTNQRKVLIRGGTDGQYVDSGHLVYAAAGSLRAVRFDPFRLEVVGDPVPVVEQVTTMQTGATDFRVSRQGTLVYVPGGSESINSARSLAWVTRDGHEEPIAAPPRAYAALRLSPDETQVALDVRDQQNDIWVWNFQRQTLAPLTFDPAVDIGPVWTPDGKRIAFASARTSQTNLYWQASDGTGSVERLTESANIQVPSSFTPDGKSLVVQETGGKTGGDLMLFHFDTRRTEPLIQTNFVELGGEISPDGRWIAYMSNESGQQQVYVRPFPNVNDGRWLVSAAPGMMPSWSKNGRELFYLSAPAAALMAVPVQTTPTFSPGNAVKLFDGQLFVAVTGRPYDVTADGKRFLMIKSTNTVSGATPTSITVVLNWTEELKARLPAR
jgi:serine/threonine-protein kinase